MCDCAQSGQATPVFFSPAACPQSRRRFGSHERLCTAWFVCLSVVVINVVKGRLIWHGCFQGQGTNLCIFQQRIWWHRDRSISYDCPCGWPCISPRYDSWAWRLTSARFSSHFIICCRPLRIWHRQRQSGWHSLRYEHFLSTYVHREAKGEPQRTARARACVVDKSFNAHFLSS